VRADSPVFYIKPKDAINDNPEKTENTIEDVNAVMPLLKRFIGKSQLSAVGMSIRGEEKQFFIDKMLEIANTIQTMPKTYGQDGMGDKAVAYLHYFKGSADWYITEKDMENEQLQAFGLADLFGDGGELGYISIEELIGSGVELDFHWKPKTIGEIRSGDVSADPNIGRSWMDGQGDEITIESLKDGKYYALRNGKVMGGPIIPEDQLEKTIALDVRQYQDRMDREALAAAEKARSEAEAMSKEKEFADVGGNPMQKGKSIAALSKMIRHNGVSKTKRQFIEDLVADGANTGTYEEDKIKPMSRMAFFKATDQQQREHEKKVKEAGKVTRYMLGDHEVSKTEYDYANVLIEKRDSLGEIQEGGSVSLQDGSKIDASRSFLQSVVDGTSDMDAETFPDQIEKAAEALGDGDVLVMQAANAYADYITKKSKELLS
jgi:hypothetical protein